MDTKIIERLLEVNEERSKSADRKFYLITAILSVLLIISITGNVFLYLEGGYIDMTAEDINNSSINQIKD